MMSNGQVMASVPARPFHERGWVVFMVGLSASVLLISGIVLFIAPSGRIANTTQWALLWLDKGAWVNLHNVFAILFVAGLVWHLVFNWKPLSNYVVSRATHNLNLKREMLVALAAIVVLVVLAAQELPPVSHLADLADYFRHEFWR